MCLAHCIVCLIVCLSVCLSVFLCSSALCVWLIALFVSLSVCVQLQSRMDRYFSQLMTLVDERKTSSRIRFLLLDTIDLRKVKVLHVLHYMLEHRLLTSLHFMHSLLARLTVATLFFFLFYPDIVQLVA